MAHTDTKNATSMPKNRIPNSVAEKLNPTFNMYFKNLKPLAPNMTGIARKNEYSAATVLEAPSSAAPIIVEPERDVPGTSANTWKNPIKSAVV